MTLRRLPDVVANVNKLFTSDDIGPVLLQEQLGLMFNYPYETIFIARLTGIRNAC